MSLLPAIAMLVVLILGPTPASAQPDAGSESDSAMSFLTCRMPLELVQEEPAADGSKSEAPEPRAVPALSLIDCGNFKLLGKNLQQKDEAGNSQFGIGLDWKYAFDKTWDVAFSPTLSATGEGFVSLGDTNSSRSTASKTASANAILNQLRFSAKGVHTPMAKPLEQGPPPERNPREMEEWKRAAGQHVKQVAYEQATGYTALDLGAQGRTESNQNFDDTQYAIGVSATAASGWAASYLLYPLRMFVPQRDEYGDVVQSPLVFLGFDEVLGASHRSKIDGTNDKEFERIRLEVAWTSELLLDGLYPFVHFHLFHEVSAPQAIDAADKETTTFLEAGADLYVGEAFQGLRQFAGGTGGPFLTFKYTTGRLPPYLELDSQVSAGFGFKF